MPTLRFLHTSDWHLGQTLHDYDRSYEHQCFLDWLLGSIGELQADALLIAGDVFDNANPSAAAQKQLYQFLRRAKEIYPALNIVLVAGNHDSAARLEAPAPLLDALGVAVTGQVTRLADGSIDLQKLVLPLKAKDGSTAAWCLALPFLRPADLPRDLPCDLLPQTAPEGGEQVKPLFADKYVQGIAELYRRAFEFAQQQRSAGQAIVAIGHCHMMGGETSDDSERNIVIGGSEALPDKIFDPVIAYAALGHLHKAQRIAKKEHLRYCGSPIPLSFAEVDYKHQILCVDLEGAEVSRIQEVRVPRSVPMLRVPAKPAPLEQVLQALNELDLPPCAPHAAPFLQVRVLLDSPQPGLRARIEEQLKDRPVRLAKIETTLQQSAQDGEMLSLEELQKLKPDQVFQRLYQQRYGNPVPIPQLQAFHELQQAAEQAAL